MLHTKSRSPFRDNPPLTVRFFSPIALPRESRRHIIPLAALVIEAASEPLLRHCRVWFVGLPGLRVSTNLGILQSALRQVLPSDYGDSDGRCFPPYDGRSTTLVGET
jgi:hypothetical protein